MWKGGPARYCDCAKSSNPTNAQIVWKVRSSAFRRKFVSWFSRKLPTSAWRPNYEHPFFTQPRSWWIVSYSASGRVATFGFPAVRDYLMQRRFVSCHGKAPWFNDSPVIIAAVSGRMSWLVFTLTQV